LKVVFEATVAGFGALVLAWPATGMISATEFAFEPLLLVVPSVVE
jgi:hypothetical protein